MNSFYLATAKITCPIDSFFTGCWKCWEYSFPDWIFLSPTLFEQSFANFYKYKEIQKSTSWSNIDFYGWINVHQSTYLRIICIAFILSKWHKILCWFSAGVREKTGANVRFRAYEGHWHVLLGFAPLYHSLAWWDTRRGQKMGRAPFLAQNPPCPGSISSAYYALPPTILVIIIICPPLWSAA